MTITSGRGSASVEDLAAASQVARHAVIAQVLKEAQPYIERLRGKTLVIKLGGSTLDNQQEALEDIVWLRGLGARPVLVHGGGSEINGWLKSAGNQAALRARNAGDRRRDARGRADGAGR